MRKLLLTLAIGLSVPLAVRLSDAIANPLNVPCATRPPLFAWPEFDRDLDAPPFSFAYGWEDATLVAGDRRCAVPNGEMAWAVCPEVVRAAANMMDGTAPTRVEIRGFRFVMGNWLHDGTRLRHNTCVNR